MAVQINKDKTYIYVIGMFIKNIKGIQVVKMKYLFDNKNESTQIKTNPL